MGRNTKDPFFGSFFGPIRSHIPFVQFLGKKYSNFIIVYTKNLSVVAQTHVGNLPKQYNTVRVGPCRYVSVTKNICVVMK